MLERYQRLGGSGRCFHLAEHEVAKNISSVLRAALPTLLQWLRSGPRADGGTLQDQAPGVFLSKL